MSGYTLLFLSVAIPVEIIVFLIARHKKFAKGAYAEPGAHVPTRAGFLRFFAVLIVTFVILNITMAIYVNIPRFKIKWSVFETENPERFAVIPFPMSQYPFLFTELSPARRYSDKYDKLFDVCFEWQQLYYEHHGDEYAPYRFEGQYIVDGKTSRLVLNGYYTEAGERVDFHDERDFDFALIPRSDYGPKNLILLMEYVPEDVKAQAARDIENSKNAVRGLSDGAHRFFDIFLPIAAVVGVYLLLRYRASVRPHCHIEWQCCGDPRSDYFYMIPALRVECRLFGRKVAPAMYIMRAEHAAITANTEWTEIINAHKNDLPARFEGQYTVNHGFAKLILNGYYTEDGKRTGIYRETTIDPVLIRDSDYGPAELRPYCEFIPEGKRFPVEN